MPDIKAEIARSLSRLIGLRLAYARDAADLKNFGFGTVRPHPSGRGTIGEYALHLQCSWRIIGSDGIVTGSSDYYEPVERDGDVHLEDWQTGNLQRKRLGELLCSHNATDQLLVESVTVDDFGGFELELSGGYRLQIFPGGSRGEDWRFFEPGTEGEHLVIAGGRIVA